MGQPEDYQGRGQGLFQHDLQGIAIDRFQPLEIVSFPLHKLLGPLDTAEELGHRHGLLRIEETGEGVDDIMRRHLSPMMKHDPPAQGEGPGAPIPGSLPKLGKGRKRLEVGIKLDQAVEDLADDSAPIDIGQKGRIKRGGIVLQHSAVNPPNCAPGLCSSGGPKVSAKLEGLCVSRLQQMHRETRSAIRTGFDI